MITKDQISELKALIRKLGIASFKAGANFVSNETGWCSRLKEAQNMRKEAIDGINEILNGYNA